MIELHLSGHYPALMVIASLSVAFALVVFRAVRFRRHLGDAVGPPNWNFSDSWASTLTAVGALFGTIVAANVLPKKPHYLPLSYYAGLSLFFGVLVVMAPFVFNATRRGLAKPTGDGTAGFEGTVWALLLASFVTLWAVLGELATLMVIARELLRGVTFGIAASVFGLVIALVILYSWRSLGVVIEQQTDREPRFAGILRLADIAPLRDDAFGLQVHAVVTHSIPSSAGGEPPEGVRVSAPAWSLL
jgi:hypothetical protein